MRKLTAAAALTALCAVPVAAQAGPEENKAVVLGYEDMVFHKHMIAEGIAKYVSPDYVQHSPEVPPGRDGLLARMNGPNSVIKSPDRHHDIIRIIASGDEVVMFAHSYKEGEKGVAVVDWFRVVGGKIVEHWDILQPVPDMPQSGDMFDSVKR